MIDESIRKLIKTVIANNPEILDDKEIQKIFGTKFSPPKKRGKKFGNSQTVRLETDTRERLNTLVSEEWKQSDLLREAIELGLPELEKKLAELEYRKEKEET